jgi:RimJ/RimL family protein N-acetyltransferase
MLSGKKIRLRPIERLDLPRFVQWFSDPEVRRYLESYMGFSMDQEVAWYEAMMKRPMEEHPFAVEAKQLGGKWLHIGNSGLMNVDWRVRSAEFGIVIGDRRFWNKGFGTDVTCTILRHAFATLNLNRVFLRVFSENKRAIRVYENVGFRQEGCMREADFREGAYTDIYLYSILRAEWEALSGVSKEK